MTAPIYLRDGAYLDTPEGGALLGGRCAACGTTFFPNPDMCQNCLSDDMQAITLGREGRLFSWSTIHMLGAHFTPPFTVGYVDLPEGPRVFGPILSEEGCTLGARMAVELAPLWEEEGVPVIGHRFRAIAKGEAR